MITPHMLPMGSVITPHTREFSKLFGVDASEETVAAMAKQYDIIIVAKSEKDIVCSKEQCVIIEGGNAGMTKGGTGDVLAGLIAALGCKNDLWLAAVAGSYFNKKAGEKLFEKVGYYFNASDLANEIPKVMKEALKISN
jgi:NAD(P)H-hydrate epimerase